MSAYRPFPLRVVRTERLGPSFVRVTLGGASLAGFDHHGYDQRINLVFLDPGADPEAYVPGRGDAPVRTYTVRAFRSEVLEVDVDFVVHNETGPAGRWAVGCRPGDRMLMVGAAPGHPVTDVAWKPPPGARRLLIAADESAVPAAASILTTLCARPPDATVSVLLEVPDPADRVPFATPPGTDVTWLVRSRGEALGPVVRDLLDESADPGPLAASDEPDDEVWDVPEATGGSFYAWLAGESGAVVAIRRHLVAERGIDRRGVAFMGYWRRRTARRTPGTVAAPGTTSPG